MSKLMINDLVESKDLDSKAMAGVFGGNSGIDFDTDSLVNEINQTLALAVTTTAAQSVDNTNNQALTTRNGPIVAPVFQKGYIDFFGPRDFGNADADGTNANG